MTPNHRSDNPSSSSSLRHCNQSRYRGVRKRKWGKWKAARDFDAALFCLRGQGAKFNFPHNPPNIQGASSTMTRAKIQEVAASYANVEEEQQQHNEDGDINRSENGPTNDNNNSSNMDWELPDLLSGRGNTLSMVNGVTDFRVFPDVNDFPGEFSSLMPQEEVGSDYVDDNDGGIISHHSLLWNF
ncbi:hypothetical protein MKX03_014208 [Papaver bracteatum]|nr:hypothetical protein MKX03_014208 [Papaver bracteatum]